MKEKNNTTPVLALLDLQQPFEIETDASGYAMGPTLMKHKKPICYHYETFSKTIMNYPTYDKELYALVLSAKKWKHKSPFKTCFWVFYKVSLRICFWERFSGIWTS